MKTQTMRTFTLFARNHLNGKKVINCLIACFILLCPLLVQGQKFKWDDNHFCGDYKRTNPPNLTNTLEDILVDRFGNYYLKSELSFHKKIVSGQSRMDCVQDIFNLNFGDGFTAEQEETICEVFNYLGSLLSTPTINNDIQILILKEGLTVGATGTPFWNATCGIANSTIQEKLNGGGQDLGSDLMDGIIRVNSNIPNNSWHTLNDDNSPTDPGVEAGDIDLFSVVLHEALHVLGFASRISSDGSPLDIVDDQGNIIVETSAYSKWDQHLFSQLNNQNLIEASTTTDECCDQQAFNTDDFPNMPTPVDGGCSNGIVFNGDAVSPGVNNGVDLSQIPPANLNGAVANKLSHLLNECSTTGESFVMHPSIPSGPAGVNRELTNTELNIMCDLGYNMTNICADQCALITQNDFLIELGNNIGINIPNEILNNDILPDQFNIEFDFTCGNLPPGAVSHGTGSNWININNDNLEPNLYSFCYTVTGCDGECTESEVFVYVGLEDECDVECNLFCQGNFEAFIPSQIYRTQAGLDEYIFQGTPGNSTDIYYGANDNKFMHVFRPFPAGSNAHLESFYMPLSRPVDPGCTINISFRGVSDTENGSVQFYASANPPCADPLIFECNPFGFLSCPDYNVHCMTIPPFGSVDFPLGIPVQEVTSNNVPNLVFGDPSNVVPYPYDFDVGNIQYFDFVDFTGVPLSNFEYVNVTGEPINFITVFVNSIDPLNGVNVHYYLDDIEITSSCDNQVVVEPNEPEFCIGQNATIEYTICNEGFGTVPSDITLTVGELPAGVVLGPGGDFVDGEVTIVGLAPNDPCEIRSLDVIISNIVTPGVPLSIPIEVVLDNACWGDFENSTVELIPQFCCDPIDLLCRVRNITDGTPWTDDVDCNYEACEGDNVRLMILPVDGDLSTFSFEWSGGTPNNNNPHILNPDGPGVYTVTVTDGTGCTQLGSINYEEICCGLPIPNFCRVNNITQGTGWVDDADCLFSACELDNVRLMIRPIDGPVSDYTYTWSGGTPNTNSPHIITPDGPGTYTVTITSNAGCTEINSITYETECCGIPNFCRIRNITQGIEWMDDDDCNYLACDQDDVRLMIRPESGSVSDYTYAWSGGTPNVNSPHVITPDGAGTYTVTITSSGGCTEVSSITYDTECCGFPSFCRVRNITQGMDWTDDDDCVYEACEGDDVRLMIQPENGPVTNYTFAWSGGTPNTNSPHIITPDGPGVYTVTITSNNGCTDEASFDYQEDPQLQMECLFNNFTQGTGWQDSEDCTHTACEGDEVNIYISTGGFSSTWTYEWNAGIPVPNSTGQLQTTGPGEYILTITKDNGCQSIQSFTLEADPEIVPVCRVNNLAQGTGWIDDGDCNYLACDQDDVRLMIRPESGLVSDYTYAWSGGTPNTNSPHIITPDGAGTYTVTITSSAGCTETASIIYDTECCGFPSICRVRNITQGMPWTDDDDCIYLACDQDNVRLMIVPDNGPTSNYSFAWSGGTPNANSPHVITPDGPGTYTVTITSNSGCTDVKSITYDTECCGIPNYCRVNNITEGIGWMDDVDCIYSACEDDNINIMIRPSNGSPSDYSYTWSGGTPNANSPHIITPNGAGTYTVTITSSGGCTEISSFTYETECCGIPNYCRVRNITQGVEWMNDDDCNYEACEGDNVRLMIRPENGPVSDYTYAWDGGTQNTNSPHVITPDGSGTYTVTITSPGGCTEVASIDYLEEAPLTLDCKYNNQTQGTGWLDAADCSYTSCQGDEVLLFIGGNSFSSSWNIEWSAGTPVNGSPQQIITDGPGDYTITITTVNGCVYTQTFTLSDEICCSSCYCGNGNSSIDPDPSDNVGVLFSDLIADGTIVTTGNLYEGYGCFAVVGQLDIDVPIEIGEGTFNMFPGSKIVIKSGVSVEIDDATFMGCEAECAQMWHGFEIEEGASLNINSVTIKDAQYVVNLKGASTASVINCELYDNFIGVFHLGTISAANDPELTFHGNQVAGTGSLKAPFPGQFTHPETIDIPFAGIFMVKDGIVDIGSDDPQAGTNVFSDMHNGIIASHGAITCKNNSFIDIFEAPAGSLFNPFNDSGYGILVSGDQSPDHYLDQEGLGSGTTGQATFENCAIAISVNNCGLEARNNKMENAGIGIEVSDNDAIHNRNTLIYDNTIFTSDKGINLNGDYSPTGTNGSPGHISGNEIFTNGSSTTFGMYLDRIHGDDGFSIYDNTVTLQSDGNAMQLRYSTGLLVENNIVNYEAVSTSGIGMLSCTGISAIANQFNGCSSGETGTCDLGFKNGISTIFGTDLYMECNEFQDLRRCISVLSPCLDMTVDVRNNTFSNYCTGIKFDFCGTTGCTDNTNTIDFAGSANNRWMTAPICTDFGEPMAAIFVNSCFATNPSGIFQISDEYVNVEEFYPLDYLSPAGEDIWFESTTEDLPTACYIAPCPELEFSCRYNNISQETGWIVTPDCSYTACENDEVQIQIVTTEEPNPNWTWEWSAGTPTGTPFVVTAAGPGEYTVTMTDENECTYTHTFTLADEECCTTDELINPDYNVILEIRDLGASGCYVTLANPGNYLFNFCDEMVCCPTGIQSYSGTYKIWSNGIQAASGGFTKSGSDCTAEGGYVPISGLSSALNICAGGNKVEAGDVMTATFSITEIVTECDLNIESFTLTPEPFLITLEDINACCEDPEVLNCSYNNTTTGSGWVNSPDCSYTSCLNDEVQIQIVTDNTPDPAWTWTWSAGTPTATPYIIIADGPGDYTVTLTDGAGNTNVKTFTLSDEACCEDLSLSCQYNNVTEATGWVLSPDCSYASCAGDEVQIQVVTTTQMNPEWTWAWSSGTPGASPNIITATGPGDYTVTVTDTQGCQYTQTFTLTDQPCCTDPDPIPLTCRYRNITQPTGWVVSDDCTYTSCVGDEVNIYIYPTSGQCTGCTYEWSAGNPTSGPFTIETTGAGDYTVTVTDLNGCTGVATFTLVEEDCCVLLDCEIKNNTQNIDWAITEDCTETICSGDDVWIQIYPPYIPPSDWTWAWSAGTPLTNFPYVIIPDGAGTYTVTVTDSENCETVKTFTLEEDPCCGPEQVLNCRYNNTTQGTGWVPSAACTYSACQDDEVMIQIVTTEEPNPAWTWEWSAGTPTASPFVVTATGPGDYTVTLTDENGCTSTQTFTLTEEECCSQDELINTDYGVVLEINDFPDHGCFVTLSNPGHYLYDFCEELICCPTGIDSYSGSFTLWSNGQWITEGGFTFSDGYFCTAGGNYQSFTGINSALNVCAGAPKVEPGDLITATFSITEIVTDCDINISSFTLTPDPLQLTLEDINACCGGDADVLNCSYKNNTFGNTWVNSPDCSYMSCAGDEVEIRIVTAQTPDPSWTWEWSAGTPTATPYIIIADGPGDYTVTLTDALGATTVKTFTLTDEVCCTDFELINTNYNTELGVYPHGTLSCFVKLANPGNYLYDFCDQMECCPGGITSYTAAYKIFSNGSQKASGSITLQGDNCSAGGGLQTFTGALGSLDVCNPASDAQAGDVITGTFTITAINTDCDLNVTLPWSLNPASITLTQADIDACCDNLPEFDGGNTFDDMKFTFNNDQHTEASANDPNSNSRSIIDDSGISINAYPNPFNNALTLDLKSKYAETYTLNMLDKNGRLVKSLNGELKKGKNLIEINDLHDLTPGIYFYRVQSSSGLYTGKVFKYE